MHFFVPFWAQTIVERGNPPTISRQWRPYLYNYFLPMTDSFTDLAQGRRQRNISGEIFMQSRPISTNDPLELAWPEEVSKEAVHIY